MMGALLDRGYIENGGKNLPTLRVRVLVHHSDDRRQSKIKKSTKKTKEKMIEKNDDDENSIINGKNINRRNDRQP